MAIKKFKVTASAKAKRAVNASTIDRLDDIQFVMQKYVDGHGGITLVKDYNNGEFDVEYNGVTVHLKFILDDPTEFVYTMDTSDNVYAHSSYEYIIPDIWKYVDYSVLANDVEGACGKKSIKSVTKAKRAVKAGAVLERENDAEIVLRDDDGAQLRVVKHPKVKGYILRRTLNNGGGSRFEWDQSKQIYDTPEEAKQAALDGTATFHFKGKSEVPPKPVQSATKKSVKAGTTPQDNVKPLSVGQARVFTYRGDPCVFVGVPNGMIFRWYPGNYETKGELNYAKTVIKKYPNEWEDILREYGFDQYDANAEYQTLSAKNPVKSSTKRKPMKKTIKASASAKRRASKKYVKAYVEEYPDWVYDWSESKTERNKRKYDEKLNEWYDVAESMYPEFYSLRGADRKAAIEEVNKAVGFTMDDVFSSSTKPVKASVEDDTIVMYWDGNKVYEGEVGDDMWREITWFLDEPEHMQDIVDYCNSFGDPLITDTSTSLENIRDIAKTFVELVGHEISEAETIEDDIYISDEAGHFEIFKKSQEASDPWKEYIGESINASIDSDYDTKVLRELEEYINDNSSIYVTTEYATYENENDWSVGLFASIDMVESDFEYYLNEQNPYLYNRLTETGLIGGPNVNNAVGANDFQFQLYPTQNQWRGPQLDIDETNLANAGDDGSVYAELKTQIDAFEIMYINALQELNYHMGDLLRKYDEGQGIHASTDVNADLQLNKYPGDREKYSYSKNSITDIDGYVQDIADGVVEKFPDLEYEISDEAITFTRDGNVIYVQAIDEIVPEREDLDDDIDELASAIQMDDELNAMREDFDAGWNATYDSDTTTRAVEMSVDDDLEPIMGDDFEEEDMGFGFTTNGEAISESMVDELCKIANEILEKSELAKYDEYTSIDRDTFDYWSDGSTYVSEKFYIHFTFTQNGGWFINNNMVDFSNSRGISEVEDFTFECDINIKDGKVVEVLYNDMPDNYSADMIDVPALTEYIEKLAAPVAGDIYNGTTNI